MAVPVNPLLELQRLGQSVWLDDLSRSLLADGTLERLVTEDGVSGVTSNPSTFQRALMEGPHDQAELAQMKQANLTAEARYEELAIPDVQAACDLLRPVFEQSHGDDGFVSLEVSPHLAYDEAATIAAARRLAQRVDRPNLLIKVPGTPQGMRAFEALTAQGLSINVTLLFSLHHAFEIGSAYIRGLRAWLSGGGDPRRVKSVASLFLSRVDTLLDTRLATLGSPEAQRLRGKSAVALAKLAYQRYQALFHGDYFAALRERGARPQYLLWASTGTKNPAYSDVLYLESLVGPETVTTLPSSTLAAFRAHGRARRTLEQDIDAAKAQLIGLESLGISLHQVGDTLQAEGVKLFADAYDKLLDGLG